MSGPRRSSFGFTLPELLAVMGIIAVLGVVISTSAQRISKEAKVSSATNQVIAALAQARGIAIRDRATVLVAFRVWQPTYRPTATGLEVIDPSKPQQTEIVFAKATGRVGFPGTAVVGVNGGSSWSVVSAAGATPDLMLEEFQVISGMPPRLLPVGMKVAGSAADITDINDVGQDDIWLSQPVMKTSPTDSERGTMLVVRFAQDGSIQTRNPALSANLTASPTDTSSVAPWIDFDRNGRMEIGTTRGTSNGKFYALDERNDESLGDHVMFLAVFDDDRFHGESNPADVASWQGYTNMANWMTGLNGKRSAYINQFCDRIQFNRFTGVAEIVSR